MSRKPKPERDDPDQSKRFEDTARELDADGTSDDFDKAIEKLIGEKAETAFRRAPNR